MTALLREGMLQKRALNAALALFGAVLCQVVVAGDDDHSQVFLEQLGDNTAQIQESGDDNRVSVYQVNVSGANTTVLTLGGEDNRARVEQRGGFLTAVVTLDEGEDNRATLRQRGEHGQLSVQLDGDRNRFNVEQGFSNHANELALNVSGYGNRGVLSQAGSGHSMSVSVMGASNGVFARQR